MYILECSDKSYYVGSTGNLKRRLKQHENGEGANHTKNRLPVRLIYIEKFKFIHEAFFREKQIQGWNRKKKEALINNQKGKLPELSMAYRDIKTTDKKLRLKKVPEALAPEPAEGPNALISE